MQPPVSTDIVRERPKVPPRHHIPSPAVTTHSSDVTPPIPKPRVRSVSPQKDPSPKPIGATGVLVLPPLTSSSSSNPTLPSYSNVPAVVSTAAPVLPSYEAAISTQPPPSLPPKPQTRTTTATTTTTAATATAAVPNPDRYTLPDPTASLSTKDFTTVKQMASMGFPSPRVARAIKHFDDSSKVRI